MVENILVKGVEQVPALVMLGLLVYYLSNAFLRAMEKRDKAFLGFQREVNGDLKDITHTIHDLGRSVSALCQSVRENQLGSCKFHEDFAEQLNRIECLAKQNKG